MELFHCVHVCWCWMDKTAIQNEAEVKELLADDARAAVAVAAGVWPLPTCISYQEQNGTVPPPVVQFAGWLPIFAKDSGFQFWLHKWARLENLVNCKKSSSPKDWELLLRISVEFAQDYYYCYYFSHHNIKLNLKFKSHRTVTEINSLLPLNFSPTKSTFHHFWSHVLSMRVKAIYSILKEELPIFQFAVTEGKCCSAIRFWKCKQLPNRLPSVVIFYKCWRPLH